MSAEPAPQPDDAQPTFHLVDPATGEIQPHAPTYHRALEELQNLGQDVANLERENTRLLRKIRSLERDKEKERQGYTERDKVLALIERWKQATNHPRSNANGADRFDLIRARRKEKFEWDILELAIDGIGAYPYVVNGERKPNGKRSQRHDRLGIPMAGSEAVEKFANLGHQARKDGWSLEHGWNPPTRKDTP